MSRIFIFFLWLCCSLVVSFEILHAQQLTRPEVLSAYLYNFAKNITWPREESLSAFRFLIITNDPALKEQTATLARQRVRGKKIQVEVSSSSGVGSSPQLIFVARDQSKVLENIFEQIEGRHVLLVTEEYDDNSRIMINFISTPDKRIRFEINRANIINQGLKILPDMVLLGGSEVDVARIYRQSQKKIRKLRGTVSALQAQQRQLEGEVAASRNELRRQQKLIARQQASISAQKEEFARQQNKLRTLLDQVEKSKQKLGSQLLEGNREIAKQKETIAWQLRLLERQKKQLETQEKNLALGRKMLDEQQRKIVTQRREIEEKEELSRQRAALIAKQRKLIILFAGSLAFIVLLTLLVYQAYRGKQHANRLLAREKENAEQANRAKTQFLAHISHELRTPLNAILGFTRILRRDKQLHREAREQVEVIQKSGRHLLSLINDILDMSKIETGSISLNPQPVDLQNLLLDVAEMVRARAWEKGLEFRLELSENVPDCVVLDGQKLSQVLLNLLGNSVKFTRRGYVILRVSCSVPEQMAGDEQTVALDFAIEDTGIGIAANALEQIFEPFVQEETEAASQGTGLGLAISRHLVRIMGGDIKVRSDLGKGTIFSFVIPATVVPESAVFLHHNRGRILGLAPGTPQYTIMIADDNGPSRKLLELLLKPVGFMVLHVKNGKEAVQMFRSARPDLILMDIRMPEVDGLEATRQIRLYEREQGGHVPIIALTAHAFEEERASILAGGCDDFIRKPFSEQEIFQVLARHLKLDYCHEERADDAPSRRQVIDEKMIRMVRALPQELCAALHGAIESLDPDAMEDAVRKIQSHNGEVAELFARLLKNFQYEQLSEALASCLHKKSGMNRNNSTSP